MVFNYSEHIDYIVKINHLSLRWKNIYITIKNIRAILVLFEILVNWWDYTYFWMPKYVNATDASARTLEVYK